MSLDFSIYILGIDDRHTCVYERNITHNLVEMAKACGAYEVLWRAGQPFDKSIPKPRFMLTARELIPVLEDAFCKLKANPEQFTPFNPKNGWGSYETFLFVVEEVLNACKNFPEGITESNC